MCTGGDEYEIQPTHHNRRSYIVEKKMKQANTSPIKKCTEVDE
jgi:hypothetical protein